MFEELRKKTFKRSLIWSVTVLIIGIGLIGWKIADLFFITDFTTLAPEEIGSQFVKLELKENYGCYLEQYKRNTRTGSERTTDLYYLILTGDELSSDPRFMTVKVPARYQNKMEQIMEDTYYERETKSFALRGKIKNLDSTDTYYLRDFFLDEGFTSEEIDAITLPYYIDFTYSTLSLNIFFGCGVFLTVYGIFRIVKGAGGGYLKKLQKDIASGGFTEASVESDFASAKSYDKKDALKCGKLMTYYTSGSEIRAIPNSKLLWCYQNTVTHRTNGVKTGTTYNVVFYVDGWKNEVTLPVDSENIAREILERYSAMFPWIIVGYTDELKKLYKKDRAQFRELRYNTCEHVAVEPGLENGGAFEKPADPE